MGFFKKVTVGILFSVLTTACGNQMQRADFEASAESYAYSTYSLTPALACSEDINITDLHGNTDAQYRGCQPDGTGTVKLYPALGLSSTVCVFPSSGGMPLRTGGVPISKCGTLSPNGSSVSFTGLSFDAVYVVRYEKYSAMVSCLNSNYPAACAAGANFSYAYGLLK